MLADVGTDRMLHLRGFSAIVGLAQHMIAKVGVRQRNRRDSRINAQRDHMLVDQASNLCTYVFTQNRCVFVSISSASIDTGEHFGVAREWESFWARQDCVQGAEEMLQLDRKLRAELFVSERVHAFFNMLQVN